MLREMLGHLRLSVYSNCSWTIVGIFKILAEVPVIYIFLLKDGSILEDVCNRLEKSRTRNCRYLLRTLA